MKAIVVRIKVGKFIDLPGLRLLSVTDDDIHVTSESVDELKVVLARYLWKNSQMVIAHSESFHSY